MTALLVILLGVLGAVYAAWPRPSPTGRSGGLAADPEPDEGEIAAALRGWSEAAGEL